MDGTRGVMDEQMEGRGLSALFVETACVHATQLFSVGMTGSGSSTAGVRD